MEFYNTIAPVEPATPEWIPVTKVVTNHEKRDGRYRRLQQKMKDNGWKLYEEESHENHEGFVEYFMHPTYGDERAQVYNYETQDGAVLKFPLIAHFDDLKGLGCSFDLSKGFGNLTSNEWTSCWDNRKGRRRLRYYAYLKRREETKKEWEAMNAKMKTHPTVSV